jgi:hypothetical protein
LVSIDFAPEREYRFSAGSDLLCRVQPGTNATFLLPNDTDVDIEVEADLLRKNGEEQRIVVVGNGAAVVTIEDATTLRLVGDEEDYMAGFGIQIEEELEARLSTLEDKLSQQLEGLDERILAHTARLTSQAERIAERAQRQAERAAERFRKGTDRQTKRKRDAGPRRGFFADEPAPAPRLPREPVSEQERLMILKMVQENKISIEEAERLLTALDS